MISDTLSISSTSEQATTKLASGNPGNSSKRMRRTRPASGRRAGLTGLQVKVWFVDRKGRAFFGEGIARLLEAIETYKSISLASKQIGMSYRYALHRISTAEERCGIDLVERFRGGGAKGGSRLTEQARNLLRKYNTAREMLRDLAESM